MERTTSMKDYYLVYTTKFISKVEKNNIKKEAF